MSAYQDGVNARIFGKSKGSNPYAKLARSPDIREWNRGWADQRKKENEDAK